MIDEGALESPAVAAPIRTPFVALLAANAISEIGSALTTVALPWFVLQTTGSAAKTGLVAAFMALPAFAAGIFGGTIVDRLGDRRTSIASDLIGGLGIALIPLLHHTTGLAFWQLLALVVLGAVLDVPGLTARRSIMPELAALGHVRLERANSAFESIRHLAMLLGPPIAGVLIAWLGASNVLWVDAATFAVSAALVAVAVPATVRRATARMGSYFAELKAGLRFLRRDRLLWTLAIQLTFTNAIGWPFFAVMLPVFVKQTYDDPRSLGLLFAAFGGGSLLGAIGYGWIGHRFSRRSVWLTAFLVEPFIMAAVAFDPGFPAVLALLTLAGLLGGPTDPLLVTVRHERIPPELRGRVFSTFSATSLLAQPIGLALAGFAISLLDLRAAMLLSASGLLVVAVLLVRGAALREFDAVESRESRVESR